MNTESNIVFYCKDCNGMFFAQANDPQYIDANGAEEIHKLIVAGHRLETVSTEVVRANFTGCLCDRQNL